MMIVLVGSVLLTAVVACRNNQIILHAVKAVRRPCAFRHGPR